MVELVRLANTEIDKGSIEDRTIVEPLFRMSGNTSLIIDADGWEQYAAQYLAHAIRRTPADLRLHTQRIFLHLKKSAAEELYGALVDLFIVLSTKGLALRQQMLHRAKTVLNKEQFGLLDSTLEEGLKDTDTITCCDSSLLSRGFSSTDALVFKLGVSAHHQDKDPLQEARDYMEYGEVKEAQSVLEEAIFEHPGRLELHHDLLEIYERTNAVDDFHLFYSQLHDISDSVTIPDEWERLANKFGRGR